MSLGKIFLYCKQRNSLVFHLAIRLNYLDRASDFLPPSSKPGPGRQFGGHYLPPAYSLAVLGTKDTHWWCHLCTRFQGVHTHLLTQYPAFPHACCLLSIVPSALLLSLKILIMNPATWVAFSLVPFTGEYTEAQICQAWCLPASSCKGFF